LQPSADICGRWLSLAWVITGALVDAHWRTLIQTKVGLELQGRVLSTNRMMALSTMPLGALAAGPLVDHVFEPLMINKTLVASTVGAFIGAGPGRGIAPADDHRWLAAHYAGRGRIQLQALAQHGG
jgi:hypothetical protein